MSTRAASSLPIPGAEASDIQPTGGSVNHNIHKHILDMDFPPLETIRPKKDAVHVATLHMRSYASSNLDLYTRFALHAAESLQMPTSGAAALPTTKELITVIKSPFVMKKSQENFERKTHRRAIKVFDTNREVVDLWLRYLKKNSIGGVGLKAYVHEYAEFGFAAGEVAELEGNMGNADLEKVAADLVKHLTGPEFESPKELAQKDKAAEEDVSAQTPEVPAEVKAEAAPAAPATEAAAAPADAKAEAAAAPAEPKA